MRNGFHAFVAHVRETKGCTLDFAVAWVDDEMMLGAQLAREFQNIDFSIVFYAGERLGTKSFFRKEIEAASADPVVDERVGPRMSSETRVEAFLEDFVEL